MRALSRVPEAHSETGWSAWAEGTRNEAGGYSPELREPAVSGRAIVPRIPVAVGRDSIGCGQGLGGAPKRCGGDSSPTRAESRHGAARPVAGFCWCSRCRKDWQDGSHQVRPVSVGSDRRRRHDFGRQSSSALRRGLFARTCCPFCTRNSRRRTTLLTLAGAGAATPDSDSLLEHGEVIAHSSVGRTTVDVRRLPIHLRWPVPPFEFDGVAPGLRVVAGRCCEEP